MVENIDLAHPFGLTIADITKLIELHCEYSYTSGDSSRLPLLAMYAMYQCIISNISRFSNKTLCPLESHTSADSQSGQIGDIQVNNADGTAFEGIEIKHQIQITPDLIQHAYEKFMVYPPTDIIF